MCALLLYIFFKYINSSFKKAIAIVKKILVYKQMEHFVKRKNLHRYKQAIAFHLHYLGGAYFEVRLRGSVPILADPSSSLGFSRHALHRARAPG